MVQQRVLAHEGITAAARDFLATKLQTSNVPVRFLDTCICKTCAFLNVHISSVDRPVRG